MSETEKMDDGEGEKDKQQKGTKDATYRDYYKEAKEASSCFFSCKSIEEARKHIDSLESYVKDKLPKVNTFAREEGPTLAKFKRLSHFLNAKSNVTIRGLLTKEEQQKLDHLSGELETSASVMSQEQTFGKLYTPSVYKPTKPNRGFKRSYNGSSR